MRKAFRQFMGIVGRNPFLFRGPIPTRNPRRCSLGNRGCRNPFLFRGPIPTRHGGGWR